MATPRRCSLKEEESRLSSPSPPLQPPGWSRTKVTPDCDPSSPPDPCLLDSEDRFFAACRAGVVDLVKGFLCDSKRSWISVQERTDRRTALHVAADAGQYFVAKHLLNNCADVRARDNSGRTPLHLASASASLAIVKLLLDYGAKALDKDRAGNTPLHHMVVSFKQNPHYRSRQLEIAQRLLLPLTNMHVRNNNGETPLHCASSSGMVEVAKFLLKNYANVNATDHSGETPLHKAAKEGDTAMISVLVQAGGDPRLQNKDGQTSHDLTKPTMQDTGLIPVNIRPADPELVYRVSSERQEFYKMSAVPRGRAIILVNEHFICGRDLPGTSTDAKNLEKLFKALDFKTVIWKDLTAQQIKRNIEDESQSDFHRRSDAFIFYCSSHGNRDLIYGTDNEEVKIGSEIIDKFDANNCRYLAGKPKLFFIDACRGHSETCGVTLNDSGLDDDMMDQPPNSSRSISHTIHEKADMLKICATISGYVCYEDGNKGSAFMRELVSCMNQNAHDHEICQILTKVNNHLNASESYHKQISEFSSRLTKWLYLLPGS